jgi:hypothetical protein
MTARNQKPVENLSTVGAIAVATKASRSRKPLPEVEKAVPAKSSARTLAEKAARFQQLRTEALKRWRSRED